MRHRSIALWGDDANEFNPERFNLVNFMDQIQHLKDFHLLLLHHVIAQPGQEFCPNGNANYFSICLSQI